MVYRSSQSKPEDVSVEVCRSYCGIFIFSDFFSALATLVQEYVGAANSPGAVPVIQSAWDVFTKTKCTQALNDAKAVYE